MLKITATEKKAAAVIPARYGSTRFPGKVLADLGGRPVLQWVYESCAGSGVFTRIIVATDNEKILRAALDFGAEAKMTDPGHCSGTERVAEVARDLTEEIVVNVQGDEPFVTGDALWALVDAAAAGGAVVSTPVTAITETSQLADPTVVKVVFDSSRKALYFSRWPIPFCRDSWQRDNPWGAVSCGRDPRPGSWWKHVGLYAFKRRILSDLVAMDPSPAEELEKLEQLRWLQGGVPITCVIVPDQGISIDTPEDLDKARRLIEGT